MKVQYILKLVLLSTLIISSCKKFVEVDPPKTDLISSAIYNEDNSANSALLTIYANMYNQEASSYHLAFTTGISGDELVNNSDFGVDLYTNSIDPINSFYANPIWKRAYNYIYLANAVYEGCNASKSLTVELKKQLMAEAIFARAYWYFYLVNLYGDVPLILTTNYASNSIASKTPINKVYEQIVTDLIYAQKNLKSIYVSADGLTESSFRVRPNQSTATALLARVYLYMGRYSDAEVQSSSIINNTSVYSITSLDKVFLKDSKEAIWQIMPSNNSVLNTIEGNNFIPESSSITEGKPILSNQIINSFEPGDLRATNWIAKFTDTTITPTRIYYYPYKYKIREGDNATEYSTIFRLAEQYLIRAEARNELNKTIDAISDLNVLRARSRASSTVDVPNPLPALQPSLTKIQVTDAILHERMVELFTEQGHRWFDLKRTNKIDGVMTSVAPLKGGVWINYKKLWPVPQSELLNDPKLLQNFGYN